MWSCWGRGRPQAGGVGALEPGQVALPSAAGVGTVASAQASHAPSRSGWLEEAVTLLGSAGRPPTETGR